MKKREKANKEKRNRVDDQDNEVVGFDFGDFVVGVNNNSDIDLNMDMSMENNKNISFGSTDADGSVIHQQDEMDEDEEEVEFMSKAKLVKERKDLRKRVEVLEAGEFHFDFVAPSIPIPNFQHIKTTILRMVVAPHLATCHLPLSPLPTSIPPLLHNPFLTTSLENASLTSTRLVEHTRLKSINAALLDRLHETRAAEARAAETAKVWEGQMMDRDGEVQRLRGLLEMEKIKEEERMMMQDTRGSWEAGGDQVLS
jgi:hypothetical protein